MSRPRKRPWLVGGAWRYATEAEAMARARFIFERTRIVVAVEFRP